jgi:hypothetical protein
MGTQAPFEIEVYDGMDGVKVIEVNTPEEGLNELPYNQFGPVCRINLNDGWVWANPVLDAPDLPDDYVPKVMKIAWAKKSSEPGYWQVHETFNLTCTHIWIQIEYYIKIKRSQPIHPTGWQQTYAIPLMAIPTHCGEFRVTGHE